MATPTVFIIFHILLAAGGYSVLRAVGYECRSFTEKLCYGLLAGFPLYSLIVFTMLILRAPLTPVIAWLPLAAMLAPIVHLNINKKRPIVTEQTPAFDAAHNGIWRRATVAEKLFVVSMVSILLFKFLVAGWFIFNTPPYFDDAMNNWNIRAKNIFYEGGIFFDPTATDVSFLGGPMANYPFLHVAYKSALAVVLGGWSEGCLNMIHLLLPTAATVLFAVRLFGISGSLFLSALFPFMFASIPLSFFHLFTSYSDSTVGIYSMLTILCFADWFERKHPGALFAAGLFMFGAAFAKNDGIVIVWCSLTTVSAIYAFAWRDWKLALPSITSFLLLLPNSVMRLIFHLPLNPLRGPDDGFFYRRGSAEAFIEVLFDYGHAGIFWFVVPALFLFFGRRAFQSRRDIFAGSALLLMFVMILFTFLFTPASEFLFNQMTVNRALMYFSAPLTLYLSFLCVESVRDLKG